MFSLVSVARLLRRCIGHCQTRGQIRVRKMDKGTRTTEQRAMKRKFFKQIVDWYHDEGDFKQVDNAPEVTELARILSCCGYQIKQVDTVNASAPPTENEFGCRVVISCAQSGLRVVMESDDSTCRCPELQQSTVSFWQVTSRVPAATKNQEKKMETGSSYIPKVNSAIKGIIGSVFGFLVKMLSEPVEIKPYIVRSSFPAHSRLRVPETNLLHRSLAGSAPELYGPQDGLMSDPEMIKSQCTTARHSSQSVEAMDSGKDTIFMKKEIPWNMAWRSEESILSLQSDASESRDCESYFLQVRRNLTDTMGLIEYIRHLVLRSQAEDNQTKMGTKTSSEKNTECKDTHEGNDKGNAVKTPLESKFKTRTIPVAQTTRTRPNVRKAATPSNAIQSESVSTKIPTPRPPATRKRVINNASSKIDTGLAVKRTVKSKNLQ